MTSEQELSLLYRQGRGVFPATRGTSEMLRGCSGSIRRVDRVPHREKTKRVLVPSTKAKKSINRGGMPEKFPRNPESPSSAVKINHRIARTVTSTVRRLRNSGVSLLAATYTPAMTQAVQKKVEIMQNVAELTINTISTYHVLISGHRTPFATPDTSTQVPRKYKPALSFQNYPI